MRVALLALAALAFAAPAAAQLPSSYYAPQPGYGQPAPSPYGYGQPTATYAPTYAPAPIYQPAPINLYQPLPCRISYYQLTLAEQQAPAIVKLTDAVVAKQKLVQAAINKAGEYFNKNSILLGTYYSAKARSDQTKLAADIQATAAAKKAAAVPLAAYVKLVASVDTAQTNLEKADAAVQTAAAAVIKKRTAA